MDLDLRAWTLILGRRRLDRTLRTYAEHYNGQRPRRALALATPVADTTDPRPVSPRDTRRRDLLGGLIHEYHGLARNRTWVFDPQAPARSVVASTVGSPDPGGFSAEPADADPAPAIRGRLSDDHRRRDRLNA